MLDIFFTGVHRIDPLKYMRFGKPVMNRSGLGNGTQVQQEQWQTRLGHGGPVAAGKGTHLESLGPPVADELHAPPRLGVDLPLASTSSMKFVPDTLRECSTIPAGYRVDHHESVPAKSSCQRH